MTRIHHYISLVIFTIGLMLGVQIPNFVDQYVKRIDASHQEAQRHVAEYQAIAKRYGLGSIEALIEKHENSSDLTFQAEAEPLKNNYLREKQLQAEMQALYGSFWAQGLHLIVSGDREIISETYFNYSANLPLNSDAAICGLSAGLLLSFFMELLWSLLARLLRRKPKMKKPPVKPATDPEPKRMEPYIRR